MKTLAVFMLFLLTACQTPEQIQAARERQQLADYNVCVEEYGFKPKSDAARSCMLQIQLAREQRYYTADPYPRFYGGYYYWH